MKAKLTKEQREAIKRYEYCLRQEDRLGGSVFANAHNMAKQESKTLEAYEYAKRLGVAQYC
jgi:hypothetical protein